MVDLNDHCAQVFSHLLKPPGELLCKFISVTHTSTYSSDPQKLLLTFDLSLDQGPEVSRLGPLDLTSSDSPPSHNDQAKLQVPPGHFPPLSVASQLLLWPFLPLVYCRRVSESYRYFPLTFDPKRPPVQLASETPFDI